MTINVTQEDIDKGKRGNCRRCPIASAVKRSTNIRDIHVDGFKITFNLYRYNQYDVCTPPEAEEFINAFDAGATVIPFSFEMEVPNA